MNNYECYPSIKTFVVNNHYYCYDAYSNRVFSITKNHLIELNTLREIGEKAYNSSQKDTIEYHDIELLLNKGYFQPTRIKKIENFENDYVHDVIERCISEITLQITKECNFSCRYCQFATKNNIGRTHSKETMSWITAKDGIDFLYNHSSDCEIVKISFYGGEPLTEFSLIKNVVEYAETLFVSKTIKYYMTTNGSIMNDEIADFLKRYSFNLAISFDGSQNIQNFHRRLLHNGKGTYGLVLRHVEYLKNNYAKYFGQFVSFISVILDDESVDDIMCFFRNINIDENKVRVLYADMSGIDYKPSSIIHSIINENTKNSAKTNDEKNKINKFKSILTETTTIPPIWHHSGPCIPSFQRLFLSINGDFYICEKIIENKNFKLGNIKNGINIDSVLQFMNIGRLSIESCLNCWAKRFCSICALYCIDYEKESFSTERKKNACKKVKHEILNYLKSIVTDEGEL